IRAVQAPIGNDIGIGVAERTLGKREAGLGIIVIAGYGELIAPYIGIVDPRPAAGTIRFERSESNIGGAGIPGLGDRILSAIVPNIRDVLVVGIGDIERVAVIVVVIKLGHILDRLCEHLFLDELGRDNIGRPLVVIIDIVLLQYAV